VAAAKRAASYGAGVAIVRGDSGGGTLRDPGCSFQEVVGLGTAYRILACR